MPIAEPTVRAMLNNAVVQWWRLRTLPSRLTLASDLRWYVAMIGDSKRPLSQQLHAVADDLEQGRVAEPDAVCAVQLLLTEAEP